MRILKFAMTFLTLCLASLAFLSPSIAQPLFQPSGSVLGNIDSVAQLPPHVVLDYIANVCANVFDNIDDDVMFPENSDCLFENYVSIQFPGQVYGNICSPPDVSLGNITMNLQAAATQCPNDNFTSFIETASVIVMEVFSVESCFVDLCAKNDSILHVESHYIEHCAGVRLPYPAESEFSMFLSQDEADDFVLTCMLDYAMQSSPFELGFDYSPPVPCWPPAYKEMETVCPDSLAKQAFDHCSQDDGVAFVMLEKDEWFSMSMKIDDYYDDDYTYYDDGDDALTLHERFCNILIRLSTEEGRECLTRICDPNSSQDTDMPSDSPSSPPSLGPSTAPSASPTESLSSVPTTSIGPSQEPSIFPSQEPSIVDSDVPSLSQMPTQVPTEESSTTAVPSFVPSFDPSPTAAPSESQVEQPPSASPSSSPSAAPTLIITNPEPVQSSATLAAVSLSLTLILTSALVVLAA